MRTTLIIFQAAILSVLAVVGAMGETDQSQSCPLPSAQANQHCHD
ncbi:MAG TPA: hypothetical protein VJ942_07995 [Roseovarius sp.]|jgi:hypothetical protein|nr:hypothetical protein [Roseovarius sp.]